MADSAREAYEKYGADWRERIRKLGPESAMGFEKVLEQAAENDTKRRLELAEEKAWKDSERACDAELLCQKYERRWLYGWMVSAVTASAAVSLLVVVLLG